MLHYDNADYGARFRELVSACYLVTSGWRFVVQRGWGCHIPPFAGEEGCLFPDSSLSMDSDHLLSVVTSHRYKSFMEILDSVETGHKSGSESVVSK